MRCLPGFISSSTQKAGAYGISEGDYEISGGASEIIRYMGETSPAICILCRGQGIFLRPFFAGGRWAMKLAHPQIQKGKIHVTI